ncbi:hypothetical protein NIES2119_23650 [[Phormidium ambiguum] IAM M-71]|uniref:Uncharacterized protein n=1 Tax=[Phormidium ambiguum] IAM M-71 TaxID=454136 RepID=A0A1U7I9U7_9CYAN|nr:hypothetical protein [Phormidium ambiguum]OKH33224.1 hypothetical protein NIES2119_23650 [Phormidium ambiguum IAM M-71]
MESSQKVGQELSIAKALNPEQLRQGISKDFAAVLFKKLKGGFFLVIGFLLSPLSWWNDLFFNLPIAYGFGYLCSLLSPKLLLPCTIIGYWISCIAGILLMQAGVMDVFQDQSKERNFKKELLMGIATSTAYTLVILALLQLKILDTPLELLGNL